MLGTSSVARGLSGYIDSLLDDRMAGALRAWLPIDIGFLAAYPDLLSFVLVLLVAVLLSVGVKESSWMNIAFTAVNLGTIVVMIVAGAIKGECFYVQNVLRRDANHYEYKKTLCF